MHPAWRLIRYLHRLEEGVWYIADIVQHVDVFNQALASQLKERRDGHGDYEDGVAGSLPGMY
jgi:hypothetical protein